MSTESPAKAPSSPEKQKPMSTSDTMAGVKKVYVLDCGGQYAHLIASRIRKHEALSVIVAADTPAAELVGALAALPAPPADSLLVRMVRCLSRGSRVCVDMTRHACRCGRRHRVRWPTIRV
jgi:hypothetical protein